MRFVSKLQSLIFDLFGTRASKHAASATSSNRNSLHDTQETAWIDGHGIRRSVTDVFVSYHRGDSVKVRAVVGQLNAEGMTVFWDPVIPAGVHFVKFIERRLTTPGWLLSFGHNGLSRANGYWERLNMQEHASAWSHVG